MALDKFKKKGYTYFQLRISCPVCIDQGKNTAQSFWVHYRCDGAVYVGDNAYFECKKCGAHDHVKEWRFGCPSHSGDQLEFLKATSQGFAQAVSTAGQMVRETGQSWLIKFLENMGEF